MDQGLGRIGILGGFSILVAFYLAVGAMVLSPRVDEDYRRTYLTREFGVFPPSAFFKGRNGLDYVPGTTVDMTVPVGRHHLNRFDWIWRGPPGPLLDGFRGRLFLHVTDDRRAPERPHRLTLTMVCRFGGAVEGRFTVLVGARTVARFACPRIEAPFDVVADLPAGLIGRERYDAITLLREPEGWADRVWTEVGARLSGFSLVSFKVEPQLQL